MIAEMIDWDGTGGRVTALLIAFLLGVVVTGVPCGVLLIRARRRRLRLRQQIARLTTSTALLTGSSRNGLPQRVGESVDDEEPGGAPSMASWPDSSDAPESSDAWAASGVSDPVGDAVAQAPPELTVSPPRQGAKTPPEDQDTWPSMPANPAVSSEANHSNGGSDRSDGAETAHHNGDSPIGDFASEESAARFRREYVDPMNDSRRQLAELRSRLSGELRWDGDNGHGGDDQQTRAASDR